MGSEIPDTFPKPVHEFSVVSRSSFHTRFSDAPTIMVDDDNERECEN